MLSLSFSPKYVHASALNSAYIQWINEVFLHIFAALAYIYLYKELMDVMFILRKLSEEGLKN